MTPGGLTLMLPAFPPLRKKDMHDHRTQHLVVERYLALLRREAGWRPTPDGRRTPQPTKAERVGRPEHAFQRPHLRSP